MNKQKQYIEIDILKLVKAVIKKWWIVVLATLIVGILAFDYASYFVTPLYQAKAQMLVDNSGQEQKTTSTSTGELNAAQMLADTYMVILTANPTLEAVKEYSGLEYTTTALKKMVKTRSVNGTEVFEIIVTAPSAEDSATIANALTTVLPEQLKKLKPNSIVTLLEPAEVPQSRFSPNRTRYAILGAMIGFIISVAVIVIIDLLDDVIHDEEYLTQTYELPILAVVPDLLDEGQGHSTEYAYSASNTAKGDKNNA